MYLLSGFSSDCILLVTFAGVGAHAPMNNLKLCRHMRLRRKSQNITKCISKIMEIGEAVLSLSIFICAKKYPTGQDPKFDFMKKLKFNLLSLEIRYIHMFIT